MSTGQLSNKKEAMIEAPADPQLARGGAAAPEAYGRWWSRLHGVALLLIIVSYTALIVSAFFILPSLLLLAVWVELPQIPRQIFAYTLLVVELAWAVRLGWHFWEILIGLVTSRHDAGLSQAGGVLLSRDEHGKLLAMFDQVSREVGVPSPDEVRVTHRTECCVLELREFSFKPRRRLILYVGLPNLLVLSRQELRVILIHEFAHISRGDTRLESFACRFLDTILGSMHALPRWIRGLDPAWWLGTLYFGPVARLMAFIQREQELRADAICASHCGGGLAAHTLLKDWMVEREFEVLASTVRQVRKFGMTKDSRNLFRQFSEYWHDFSRTGDAYLEKRLTEEEMPEGWDSEPSISLRLKVMRQSEDKEIGEDSPVREMLGDFDRMAMMLEDVALDEEEASVQE